MNSRFALHGLALAFLIAWVAGCQKSKPTAAPAPFAPPALSPDTAARVHWVGQNRLGVMGSAYYLTRLWELPESKKVEARVLELLAVAPWRMPGGEGVSPNAQPQALGPVLQNLVEEEAYFEMRRPGNGPDELVLATRGSWRTNLVIVITSLTGIQTMDVLDDGRRWVIKRDQPSLRFDLVEQAGWTVLGVGQGTNRLLGEIVQALQHPGPSAPASTNWLEAYFDLSRLRDWLPASLNRTGDWPRVSLAITGDGGNVLTDGRLTFSDPVHQGELDPWSIPGNAVRGPLVAFSAARGLRRALVSWDSWQALQLGATPDQVCFWSRTNNAFHTYAAFPLPNASDEARRLADRLVEKANPWLAAHDYVGFERLPEGNGATWGSLPMVRPFFAGDDGLFLAGLFPPSPAAADLPLPAELAAALAGRTNLLAYGWELTGARVEGIMSISQLVRQILHRSVLPMDSVSVNWLRVLTPRLGECETTLEISGANQLSFHRKSTVGFTAIELQLLADWIESPRFPIGLHSVVVPPQAPPAAPAQ